MGIERKIIGVLANEIHSHHGLEEPNLGFIKCLYEIFPNKEIHPINKKEIFCETGQIFVRGGYSKIFNSYNNNIFLCICSPANNWKSGDSRYTTTSDKISKIQANKIIEILDVELPDVNYQKFSYPVAPKTQLIILFYDKFLYGPFEYDSSETDIDYLLNIKTRTVPQAGLLPYFIAKTKYDTVSSYLNEIEEDGQKRKYIVNIDKFIKLSQEKIDYMNDSQIVNKLGQDILKNSNLSRILNKKKSYSNR